jgi:hypothetical protein
MAEGSEVCVFWDFASRDWNHYGCTVTKGSTPQGIVTCQCDHLTNFAVLVVSVTLALPFYCRGVGRWFDKGGGGLYGPIARAV